MEYRTLGRTGIQVSPLCLGTLLLGSWGTTDEDECRRIVHTALDAGINFIDTADVYSFGESEQIVGRAIKGRRDDIVLATKFNNPMDDSPNRRGNSRRWIMRAVEDSLRRLDTDYIDLYQVHRPDPLTDIDETLGALSDLVRQGKVRAIGTSSFPAEELVEAQWAAERRSRERFSTEQLSYSILARHAEAASLPVAERYGLGVMVWSPLNGGWLTGKYRRDAPPPKDSRASTNAEHFDFRAESVREVKLELTEKLGALAAEAGMSLIHLALGFVLSHRAVTSAVIGPRTVDQLASQLGAVEVSLTPAVLDAIDEIVPPGTSLSSYDIGYTPPALTDATLRRRPHQPGRRASTT
ncbi:aryl-alcohol dehydrogenase-like predicted oxidoreductase [Thermocatellispora tengchongensis]|uniref:Aryl-alcohol dehydrogenase-like predicted oxidoreductase n=1 Tax=Thermocatellispora tengchongensis TaxID=1073253 RepID=A0A840NVY5_9ACTN|nr:aldo/keto reductase [Thermocatellispora tengchongensis]MBB5130969.1 aryl-alcohol dehydrogenase-like predicted oxidoreductase [Thermocatellispora tengchongensis]